MPSSFQFSERGLRDLAKQVVRDEAKDLQRRIDMLARRYKGRPIAEVKRALAAEWRRGGGTISDPELTDWATCIHDGTRIEFTAN